MVKNIPNIDNKNFATKERICLICEFPLSEHPRGEECYDDKCILGRYMEVVNNYASTCDGCQELTMHEDMMMDEETQLGYCEDCVDEYIVNNINEDKEMYKIELFASKDGPRFRIIASNGKIIASSEAYSSNSIRSRTVKKLVENHNFTIKEDKKKEDYVPHWIPKGWKKMKPKRKKLSLKRLKRR